jgi:hypothetical protein
LERLHRSRRHVLVLAVLVSCVFAGRARAFSDPLSYGDQALIGGGGGRWFTGSSADGFGCEVCHSGGTVADLSIGGLPFDGFTPGTSYEITIAWPASAEHVALIAELTDEARMGVGALSLPRPEATPEAERCGGELLGAPSSALHVAESGRQLVSVIDCGAQRLRFQWTVPAIAPEAVWLHVGFATSNEDTTPAGDGVTMARRVMLQRGSSRQAQVLAKGCAVTRVTSAAAGALLPVLLLSLLLWRRAREVRRCERSI